MGIIDAATITVTCPECGLSESDRVRDKGSGWGGSSWETPSFTKFDATVSGGGKTDPEVSATCPSCKVSASVDLNYGM